MPGVAGRFRYRFSLLESALGGRFFVDDQPVIESSLGLASLSVNWYAAFLMTLLRLGLERRVYDTLSDLRASIKRVFDALDLTAIPPEFYVTPVDLEACEGYNPPFAGAIPQHLAT